MPSTVETGRWHTTLQEGARASTMRVGSQEAVSGHRSSVCKSSEAEETVRCWGWDNVLHRHHVPSQVVGSAGLPCVRLVSSQQKVPGGTRAAPASGSSPLFSCVAVALCAAAGSASPSLLDWPPASPPGPTLGLWNARRPFLPSVSGPPALPPARLEAGSLSAPLLLLQPQP